MGTMNVPAQEDLALAREFARRLQRRLDGRDVTVTLFGSRARGEGNAESDLDLFVSLGWDDPEETAKTLALDIACDLTLEKGVLVSVFVADRRFLEDHRGYTFLDTIATEGIRV